MRPGVGGARPPNRGVAAMARTRSAQPGMPEAEGQAGWDVGRRSALLGGGSSVIVGGIRALPEAVIARENRRALVLTGT
ncbi:hypothetical protein G6F32_017533 [Rhizopus arrhizus]|nr:hypothetical protein G6F32_017533 [Rhizopus arrhizus]